MSFAPRLGLFCVALLLVLGALVVLAIGPGPHFVLGGLLAASTATVLIACTKSFVSFTTHWPRSTRWR